MNGRSKAQSIALFYALAMMPTFGHGNDMRATYIAKPKSQCSSDGSKPNKRRSKVKASRKANLKNRK